MPIKKTKKRLTIPWWTEELAEMKKRVATSRRRIRNAAPVRRALVVSLYLELKENYMKAVKNAQTESWKEFCGKQSREGVWEGIYRDREDDDDSDHCRTRQLAKLVNACGDVKNIRAKLESKKIIVLVSLDIEGAFDSAWWPAIKVRLAEEKCPINLRRVIDSYLSDREVIVRYAGAENRRKTSKGCVQGSIGGPILWNLLLDPLLKQLEARGNYCQAFADDVVMLFDGGTALEIEQQANAALEHVRAWGVKNKLKFAPHKTSAMVITRKLKYDTPRLAMGGIDIGMSKEVKILGLTIDAGLTFNSHVAGACKKAIAIYKHLARSARVSWGLHPEVVRSIYTAVVEPIVLYAASAWAPAVNKLGIRKQLNVVQRGFAQKLCRAHRTVSLHSALLLAGILPLDLRVREAASLYEAKRGLPHSALGDRDIETMTSAMDFPHPAEQTTVEFSSLVDEEQYNNHAFNYDVRIFTDGSKIEGKVGAALSLWDSATEIKSKKLVLPSYCTVYQAELLALQRAAGEVLNSEKTTFGIFSDSMAALQTVANPTSPIRWQWKQEMLSATAPPRIREFPCSG
ncbi:uncharacterized protein LOC126912227 [Spodoptera frugiperda]|uniref:Uncharacterized protein LOC126912227 n=1 Tax=Spodoptera frugiperda TaxID=7108 RepID=A0A9R0F2D5_SPOFR|nr:uncharacterized protein LOC126912227 [Spodoptera frugiperda]